MSNTLSFALASLGGVVLAGVIAHGAWSARRAAPRRAARTATSAGRDRADPVSGEARGAPASDFSDAAGTGSAAGERRPNRRVALRLDALIDAIATLRLEAPIAGAQVVAQLPSTRRAGSKPYLIEGLNTASGEWEPPSSAHSYGELQAGIQLANRSGALNEIEYSEFVQKVQAFAEAVGALADFPDMLEAVAAGRELDQFADAHDAQLAVQLQAHGIAWSVGYVQQQAARHGFLPGVVPGRLVMPNDEEGAPPMLTLLYDSRAALADDPNLAALRELTLAFDVPQTPAGARPFEAWRASAQALAAELEANLVDDLGRPLAAEGFDAIGNELVLLYTALEARDLAAGSPAARRLFG